MKTIHVKVTQSDIDEGMRKHPCRCPISIALYRVLGCGTGTVWVHEDCVSTNQGHGRLPAKAKEFIYCYDSGQIVDPIEFDLELQEERDDEHSTDC